MGVVVLTASYVYWGERSLKEALKLIVRGKVEIVEADESREIRAGISRNGVTFKIPAPLVIRLLNFVGYKIKKEKVNFSEEAVYIRDGNICQYFHTDENGRRFKYKCMETEKSIDHVLPLSRGGKNCFTNCVCCCKEHNTRVKRNRTPGEAGLVLIRKPFVPVRRKGDMAIITFSFNPGNKAHVAYYQYMGMQFSHVAR